MKLSGESRLADKSGGGHPDRWSIIDCNEQML